MSDLASGQGTSRGAAIVWSLHTESGQLLYTSVNTEAWNTYPVGNNLPWNNEPADQWNSILALANWEVPPVLYTQANNAPGSEYTGKIVLHVLLWSPADAQGNYGSNRTFFDNLSLDINRQTSAVACNSAEVITATDYYPFGMEMPGRSQSANGYRYGFQGQEKDDEIKGGGNSINFKFRMYDPRLGRFFAVDPLAAKYAYNSPYAFSENRLIDAIELEGLEKVLIFGGADLFSDGQVTSTMVELQTAVQTYSDANNLGATVTTYNTTVSGAVISQAYNDIKSNYKKGEKIILYGYSMGGVAANQVAKLLKADGIMVDILVTVDAAWGPLSKPLHITENVEINFNIYQTETSSIYSRGYESESVEGNDNSLIVNYNYDEAKSKSGNDAHGAMDEDTKTMATDIINNELSDDSNANECTSTCESGGG